jgi:hypothetical protein
VRPRQAGSLTKEGTGGVSDMYSTHLCYRPLRKRVNVSPVNFQTRVCRIHTGSVQSPAKIDGWGFYRGGMAGICVGMRAPFQGSHGRQPTSRRTSSAHLGDHRYIDDNFIWSHFLKTPRESHDAERWLRSALRSGAVDVDTAYVTRWSDELNQVEVLVGDP